MSRQCANQRRPNELGGLRLERREELARRRAAEQLPVEKDW